jgi:thioredoxin
MKTANSGGAKLCVVQFSATWCGPCKMISPIFEKMATQYPRVLFAKVDVDEAEEVAKAHKVTGMPTFVFVHKNAERARVTGAKEPELRAELEKLSKETSAFSGSGYSLSGPSAAAPAAAAASSSSSASAAAGAAPAPRRNNPWADPNVCIPLLSCFCLLACAALA